ncbi:MAG: hypothetical protein AAFZ06_06785 [Pseudomonadota bacterium]
MQDRLAEAQETIAEARRLERDTTLALRRKTDLEAAATDVAGELRTLEARQQEMSAHLQQTETAMERLGNRRRDLQRDVDRLAPAVDDLRAQERRVEQLRIEQQRLERNEDSLNATLAEGSVALTRLQEETAAADARWLARQKELITVQAPHDALKPLVDELGARKADLDANVSDAEARLAALLNEADVTQKVLARIEARRAETVEALNAVQEQFLNRNTQLSSLQAQIASVQEALVELDQRRSELSRLQADIDRLEARRSALDGVLPDLEASVQEARSGLASARTDAEIELVRVAELAGQAARLEADIARLGERRDGLGIELQSAPAATEEVQATLQTARTELEKLDAWVDARNADLTRSEKSLVATNERIKRARARLEQIGSDRVVATSAADPATAPEGAIPLENVRPQTSEQQGGD